MRRIQMYKKRESFDKENLALFIDKHWFLVSFFMCLGAWIVAFWDKMFENFADWVFTLFGFFIICMVFVGEIE